MSKMIYLSGAMSVYSMMGRYDLATEWRSRAVDYFEDMGVDVFDPTAFKYVEDDSFNFDLYHLRHSNIMIVKFANPKVASVGTDMELMLCHELNIPVICINESGTQLDPWIRACCWKEFDNEEDAYYYAATHYIGG